MGVAVGRTGGCGGLSLEVQVLVPVLPLTECGSVTSLGYSLCEMGHWTEKFEKWGLT